MRRVEILITVMSLLCFGMTMEAQSSDAVLNYWGTDAAEELSPYDIERMENLLSHPLRINQLRKSDLEESGLFTNYQIASLEDYRSRHGDVLSFTELAAVDGFGYDFVLRLAPFISLESLRAPGQSASNTVRNELAVKSGIRKGSSLAYGLKYRLMSGERFSGGIAVSRSRYAENNRPDAVSGHVALYLRRFEGKIVLGDFNARFGQGLTLWNGMSFSGLTSASSFMRKPSGVSASSSFTGGYAFRGLAADMRLGRMKISAFSAFEASEKECSVLSAANAAWFMSMGRISVTHYADLVYDGFRAGISDMKTSADAAFCFDGTDIYAEFAYDWVSSKLAALAGVTLKAGENTGFAGMLRYYPSDFSPSRSAAARSTTKCSNEYAASAAVDFSAGKWIVIDGLSGFGSSSRKHKGRASLDFAYFPVAKASGPYKSIQLKARAEWSAYLSGAVRTDIRIAERIRTWGEPFRTDIRMDISYSSEHISANLRMNMLRSEGTGLLGYAEGGYRSDKLTLYLRQGIFRIDHWEDRIYAYARDAPGTFNVPAYYGRGLWTALTMNWKFSRWGRLYMRAAMTSYPFMEEKKPGRAELKFQFMFTF